MFTKILIANRGEIALRIMRACKELGIATVAVYSEADSEALHVRMADEAYLIGPAPAVESYLNIQRIIEAALKSGAQAIHPGYGFLSENASFARACAEAGIVFIGPPPEAIDLMGSKIAAKQLAVKAGAPVVPGYQGQDQDLERLRAEAERIGFPLLIKASAGGGGKGMRTVQHMQDFQAALEGAKREARAAFGDDAVFLERLIPRARHVEIQVLADGHGNCVHLGERECSIQRRHQKIVEESPSVALTPELRAEMGAAAVRVAQAAGYRNAGTVEFLLDEQGHYYFLEMNTRLQVEHPVTEQVTGLDLVHLQIAIAAGEPLPFAQEQITFRGHAIEVRLYAEDPATFLPATGQVALFAPPQGPGIRNDAGLTSGDQVTVYYDPMLAKLIVSAPTRAAAIGRLRRALDEFTVLGVTTNLPLLRAIAAHPAFAAGETYTSFIAEHGLAAPPGTREEILPLPDEVLLLVAGRDVAQRARDGASTLALSSIDPWALGAWRAGGQGLRLRYRYGDGERAVTASLLDSEIWSIRIGEREHRVRTAAVRGKLVVLREDTRTLRGFVVERAAELLVGYGGESYKLKRVGALNIDEWGASQAASHGHQDLRAPMPGTIIKVLVKEGQEVAANQPLLVLEAMKMEHTIVAPYAGVVSRIAYSEGALVAGDAVLVELDELA
ncbi:MAG: 3-methylcrotonoyl-CoA carboxylase subunit alpha [Herpetosiphonaceae bacterium]|nr:MAG: 3-methylcrotonoyl-CoA carboxylase subunit alpha [Herpetosiphonaceae bacterium]